MTVILLLLNLVNRYLLLIIKYIENFEYRLQFQKRLSQIDGTSKG